jgi:hypothetical protein
MATTIYSTKTISLVDGTEIEIIPLKIKYLREFMDSFDLIKNASNEEETIMVLVNCVRVAMKQYYPKISKTIADIEDNLDLPTVYEILDIAANIKVNQDSQEEVKKQAEESSKNSWEDLDLAKLEAEIFLLGIWKDYQELEQSLSMPELMATLSSNRELDYQEKKFLAAMQGVDLDKDSGRQKEWEDLKARVFSKGQTSDSNDVLSLQGANAQKYGFGIGMGLDYEKLT